MAVASDRSRIGALLVAPALILLSGVLLVPELYAIYLSFFDDGRFVGLGHYRAMVQSPDTATAITNTLIFTISSVVLSVVIGFAIAVLLDKGKHAQRIVRSLAIAPFVIPPIVGAFAWKMMLDPNYGVINYYLTYVGIPMGSIEWLSSTSLALPTVIICYVWITTPFITLIILAGLQNLPKSPFEAAAVDGAGRIMVFRRVLVPMILPTLLIAAIFQCIFALREFAVIWVMTQGGPINATYVLSMDVYRTLFIYGRSGYSSAVGVLILVVTFLLTLPLLRQALR
jgi:multiple sugar transport system permease protein